jgi:hypothetical protein
VIVSLLVVALLAFLIIQKRRVGGEVDQNAAKDHSEALNLEVDGEVLKEAVKSLKSNNGNQFDFESVEVPMENSDGQTHYEDKTGNSNGGHGRMV